jgi:hypothetical protein
MKRIALRGSLKLAYSRQFLTRDDRLDLERPFVTVEPFE